MSPKATLRAVVEAWLGKRFSDRDLSTFDLRSLAGKSCLLQIVNAPGRDGHPVSSVGTVIGLPRGTAVPEMFGESVVFSFADTTTASLPESLPTWIVNLIKASDEWQRLEEGEIGF